LRSDPLHFGALTGVEASARMAGPVSRVAGACLVGAAISFWLAWWLMPLPGTTDTAFILEQVGATRARVFASVAVQVVSGALLVPGLLGLTAATPLRGSTAAFAAASLVGIGATGLAADAIYHLLAFEMTAPGVIREAMVPVMDRFQSADLVFVAPQLLALLAGVGWLCALAPRVGLAPRARLWIVLALAAALLGAVAVRAAGLPRRVVAMTVLAGFSLALAELGASLWRARS
jgi:hypothetical protein